MSSAFPYLDLIGDSIHYVRAYMPVERAAFLTDQLVQDAVLMRLQVIGENLANVRRADESLFAAYDDGSWNEIIGLRNIISHGYQEIEAERIWEFLVEDLPGLERSINRALNHQS